MPQRRSEIYQQIEFAGVKFYRNSRGYFNASSSDGHARLHRTVYGEHYGNIPRGWHIHHKDGKPSNNTIENLVAMAPLDHWKLAFYPQTKTCTVCGTGYSTRHPSSIYCSHKCTQRAYRLRKRNG